jgi:hypothetical protein
MRPSVTRLKLAHAQALGAWLQVGDQRFNSTEIERLYEAADYPLRKPERAPRARRRDFNGASSGDQSQTERPHT